MSVRTKKPGTSEATVRRDGDAIVIDIPMNLRRCSGRKEVVLPLGVARSNDCAAPDKPPTPLSLALARAFRWQEMIERNRPGRIQQRPGPQTQARPVLHRSHPPPGLPGP